MAGRAVLSAISAALLAGVAQYVGITRPATDGLAVAERQIDKREAQIARREERVRELEDRLEQCLGQPIARGVTPSAAARAEAR